MNIAIIFVFVFFSMIQFIESCGYFARVSGIYKGKGVLGYSIQNATFIVTRFSFLFLMPSIGYLLDKNITTDKLLITIMSSYFLSSLLVVLVYFIKGSVIRYYGRVIDSFSNYSLVVSFFRALFFSKITSNSDVLNYVFLKKSKSKSKSKILNKEFFLSFLIYTFFCSSVFSVSLISSEFNHYRATIMQLSGVANGIGSILLSFYLDPLISNKSGDNLEEIEKSFVSVLVGRFCSLAVGAPIVILLVYLCLI